MYRCGEGAVLHVHTFCIWEDGWKLLTGNRHTDLRLFMEQLERYFVSYYPQIQLEGSSWIGLDSVIGCMTKSSALHYSLVYHLSSFESPRNIDIYVNAQLSHCPPALQPGFSLLDFVYSPASRSPALLLQVYSCNLGLVYSVPVPLRDLCCWLER